MSAYDTNHRSYRFARRMYRRSRFRLKEARTFTILCSFLRGWPLSLSLNDVYVTQQHSYGNEKCAAWSFA